MLSDAAQIAFGADKDVTLTHVADTGIALNSKDIAGVASINKGQIGGRRNIIYNGEMKVAQRSTSETGLGAAAGYFTLDRWRMAINAASAGRYTMAQVADGPAGFANCLKLTTTTADTSIAAGELLILQQRFEGQDLQQLQKGTATAKQVTVSFYVKGNASATYTYEIYDVDNGRAIAQEFAVTTAWNRIELTFAADTTDPFDDDNARSLDFNLILHAGSTYTGGTFSSNAWKDVVNNTRCSDSQTSIFDATSRTFFITGVQMEIGATATEFESRTYGEELALCQRYLYKLEADTADRGMGLVGQAYNTTGSILPFIFPVQPRTKVTGVTISGATDFSITVAASSRTATTGLTFGAAFPNGVWLTGSTGGSLAAGDAVTLWSAVDDAFILFTGAEL
jgi:hypothetical protein